MNTNIAMAGLYGVTFRSVSDELPPGILPQSQISDAIDRAMKRVAAMNPSYRNILTDSASPTVRIPRKPVVN